MKRTNRRQKTIYAQIRLLIPKNRFKLKNSDYLYFILVYLIQK